MLVRLGESPGATRVVIATQMHLTGTLIEREPRRIVVDFPDLALDRSHSGVASGLVSRWNLQAQAGGARLSLYLSADAELRHRFVMPPPDARSPYRYVIDLALPQPAAKTAQALPDAAGSSSQERIAPRAIVRSARLAPRHRSLVVVIDAGHGGQDPGAQGLGTNEKDLTLAAALALRDRLERGGRYRVVMTRDTDVFVPLDERVRIARRARADLFIALHADSAGSEAGPHGASVYTLSGHGEARVKEVLDGHEWFNRAGPRNDPAVGGILLDLTQRTTLNRSARFAQLIVAALGDQVDLLPHSHRDAGYFVLLAPDVPAVLLEMGFITNPLDQARLSDPGQRIAMMNAVAKAIDGYFDGEVRLATR